MSKELDSKIKVHQMRDGVQEELSPYISALVHHDDDKVTAGVPSDSLISNRASKSFSIMGFFRVDMRFDLRQPVNQWLSIVLLGCMGLFVVLFYFTHNAFETADNWTQSQNVINTQKVLKQQD